MAELRSAKERHDATKPAFQRAKDDFNSAKRAFDSAKAEHERAQTEFKRAKTDFDSSAKAYSVWVSTDSNGNTNIYFGGVGKPNGPGHGHYVMDRSGKVTYKRDPFDPHGAQNFEGPGKDGHRGGFGKSQHGWIGDSPVTFALGWGTRDGHTMIADGHLDDSQFRGHIYHDHYGPGDGPNNNGTLRRKYTGPGA